MTAPTPHIAEIRRAARQKQQLTCLQSAELTGYTSDHISLMLRKGTLRGEKKGRDWFVEASSLYEYVQQNPRPGRKKH
jgi:hypothetical protein